MEVRCPQCGAEQAVAADARLLQCRFCSTALVVDGAGVLFNEVMLATVREPDAASHLRRFLAGDATVAGLDRAAEIATPRLEYFPFWAFTVVGAGGERVMLEPAAPSSLSGLMGIALPAGSVESMRPGLTGEARVLEPEVPLATAEEWLKQRYGDLRRTRTVLYHLPLYRMSYGFKGRTYAAAVDGVTGAVYPADFPAKAETPYRLTMALAVVVFTLEGLAVGNLLLKTALYLLSAAPLMLVAWLTSRKV